MKLVYSRPDILHVSDQPGISSGEILNLLDGLPSESLDRIYRRLFFLLNSSHADIIHPVNKR